MGYSPWFLPKTENFHLGKKRIPSERASLEEQNDANFSFIASFSEELGVHEYSVR